jgi:hypothetical protein
VSEREGEDEEEMSVLDDVRAALADRDAVYLAAIGNRLTDEVATSLADSRAIREHAVEWLRSLVAEVEELDAALRKEYAALREE